MSITKFRFFAMILPALMVASCIDEKNVTTFASSVVVITTATSKIVTSDRATCAHINATIAEAEGLPTIGKIGVSAHCNELGKVLDAISGVNVVLGNYGKALGDVSQGTFVNYDSDESALENILKSLPAAKQPTQDQISAIGGLAGWVASLATEEARQKAISDAMVGKHGEMKAQFHSVVALLGQLVAQASDGVEADSQITTTTVGLVTHSYGSSEPVAAAEFAIRMAGNVQVVSDQKAAIAIYKTALVAMNQAFDAATARPSAKEMLADVRTFAAQARSVYQAFEKAFPLG